MKTPSPAQKDLFSENARLHEEISALRVLLEKEEQNKTRLFKENEWFREQLLSIKRLKFGPKRERWEGEEQIVWLFNEAEQESRKPEDGENGGQEEESIQIKAFTRKRGKRRPLPEHLPRRIVEVELPENERFSEDGSPLKVIGKEISEKLVYQPARMEVVQYHRLRYGVDSGDPVKTAHPVPQIVPKGIATGSLIAGVITHKYADGLPLYRQQEMFARVGVDLSRGSMARWIVQAAKTCQSIWNVLEERLLLSDYVACDETPLQVLKEKNRKPESKSWMWARVTPAAARKIVLFDYDPHRSGEVARRLLSECRGVVQVDGYSSYNWIEKLEGLTRIGCNMHGRRGFEQARKQGSKGGHSLAEQALKYYQRLYAIEKKAKEKGMTWAERFEYRKRDATAIWDEMREWADKNAKKVPPKSKIGKAFHYFTGEYERLRGYLGDGKLEIDNGMAERMIRKYAIGRNNWMFSDTPAGADASALFYSFVVTAKINGVNPHVALSAIFDQIPTASTIEDYERLADLLLSQPGQP